MQVQVADGPGTRIENAQVHGEIPRTTEEAVHFDAPRMGREDIADGDELLAGEQAAIFRRTAVTRRDDRGEIVADGETESDGGSGVGEFVRDRSLLGREQIRFGIDGADESAEGRGGMPGGVDARGQGVGFLQHLQHLRETRQRLEGRRRGREDARLVGGQCLGRQEERT